MQKFIGSFDYYKELLPDQPHQYSHFMIDSRQPQHLMIADTPRQPQRLMIADTHRASHTPSTSHTFYNNALSQDLNDELVKDRKLHGLLRVGVMSGIAKDIIKLIIELDPVKNIFSRREKDYLKLFGGKSRKQKQSRKPRKQSRKQKKSKKSRK